MAELLAIGYGEVPYIVYVEKGREDEARKACDGIRNATYHENDQGMRDYVHLSK